MTSADNNNNTENADNLKSFLFIQVVRENGPVGHRRIRSKLYLKCNSLKNDCLYEIFKNEIMFEELAPIQLEREAFCC